MYAPKPRNVLIATLIAASTIAVALLIAQDEATLRVQTPLAVGDAAFPEYLGRLLGSPLTSGDTYIVHASGDAAFPAMLSAIDRASRRVSLETYIFEPGRIAERFTTSLEKAARRGIEVRIVLDGLGADDIDSSHLDRLQRAGCKIGWFNPAGGFSLEKVNYRTHRKILAIDGDVAFVGGMGMADQWAFDSEGEPRWRDTQIEIRGPAALDVEAGFNKNWIETGGVVELDQLPHDAAAAGGQAKSIVVWSSSEGGTNRLKLLYLLAIAAARQTLDIESPYFITDESTQWSLEQARRRGVRVRILTEGDVTDAKPVKFAARADYEMFLEQGITIYEYQPAMMHAKAIVVDGVLSVVGSANFDNRSLELNDELNVAVFDQALAARLLQDFEQDITRSRRIDLEEWRARPLYLRAREKLWGYFGEVF
jgi:cardiolipin synthase